MSTAAQIEANRENAQHSTGAKTEAGKQASSRNNFRHGLTGHAFLFLEWEDPEEFDLLKQALCGEHQATTPTEEILIEKMAQHHWLSQRAQNLQTIEMKDDPFDEDVHKSVNAYLRYQAHHDRLFQRALHDLLKLRAERRKEQIGFESQKRAQAAEERREANENRKVERHKVALAIDQKKFESQELIVLAAQAGLRRQLDAFPPPQKGKIAA